MFNSNVAGPLRPEEKKIKDLVQSLNTAGKKIEGLPGTGTKKADIGAAPLHAQNPSTPGAEKSLPVLPDSQERQEIRITSERVDNQPSIDTNLNSSENLSQVANQNMEAG